MQRRTRRIIALSIGVVIVMGGSFVAFRFLGAAQVPKEFLTARDKSGVISARIVQNAQSVAQSLNDVNTLEAQKQYDQEDAKIQELTAQNQQMKDDALALSNQMQNMLNVIPEIRSDKARALAFQAVNSELSIVADLLSYGDYMEKLFGVLQNHSMKNRSAQIQGWLHEINNEVEQINNMNTQATDSFTQFDSITK